MKHAVKVMDEIAAHIAQHGENYMHIACLFLRKAYGR